MPSLRPALLSQKYNVKIRKAGMRFVSVQFPRLDVRIGRLRRDQCQQGLHAIWGFGASLTLLGQHLTELGSQRLHPVRFLDETGQAHVLESLGNLLIAVSAGQNDAHVGLNAT